MAEWLNHYLCPCGEEWEDEWDCQCNDRCPSCNKEVEPYISDDGSRSSEEIAKAYDETHQRLFVGCPGTVWREPKQGDPHRKFWEHIQAGGRVWRDDPMNHVREWLDLKRLGGNANNIVQYGYSNLTIVQE